MTRLRDKRRGQPRLRERPQAIVADWRATKGIVGHREADLEQQAMRAVQARARGEKREESLRVQAQLRREAVQRRIDHRKLAASYARDRRATA